MWLQRRWRLVAEMARNLLSRLDPGRNDVRRLDLAYRFDKRSVDTMIGRAAHIAALDDAVVGLVFAVLYGHLFD